MSRVRDKIYNKKIGQKIKEARLKRTILVNVKNGENWIHSYHQKKNCTQSELGNAIGVTFQQIQKYESGHNGLSSIKLLEVSNFFNKPLEYFTSDATELLEKVRPTDNNSVKVSEAPKNV